MSTIDDRIQEALSPEDRETMDRYCKELGLFGLIAESFRGKFRHMVIAVFIFILAFAVVLIYSAIYFFSVNDIALKLNWLAIALAALIVIGLLRLWYLMELNRLSIMRELKRIELQLSLLAKKL